MLDLAFILCIAFADALDIAGGPFDDDTLLGGLQDILHVDFLDLPCVDSDLFHEQFFLLGDLALVPLVPDLGASPVEIFEKSPYEDVDHLVIHILMQILFTFLTVEQDFVVDGAWEGVPLREICPLSLLVQEVHPLAQPRDRNHAVAG